MEAISQTAQRSLIAVFFALVYFPPISQFTVELSKGEPPFASEFFYTLPTAENLRLFEKGLADRSLVSKFFRRNAQYALFIALRDAGGNTLRGEGDWLCYTPEVKYLVQPWPPKPDRDVPSSDAFRAIVSFRDQLKAMGIGLLVVPVPVRTRVFPELLGPVSCRSHAEKLIATLEDARVETVNLFSLFDSEKRKVPRTELYLKQDTHWAPGGAKRAAEATANRLVALGWIERGSGNYSYRSINTSRSGDLWRMIDLASFGVDTSPEDIVCEQVVDSATGNLLEHSADADVLVIGDSYAGMYEHVEAKSAGFVSHLAYALRRPVGALIYPGGASTMVRKTLAGDKSVLAGKKVIVWEFIERDLISGMEGWQEVEISQSGIATP
jgi:hypothetical protein